VRNVFGMLGLVTLFVVIAVGMYGAFVSTPPPEYGSVVGLEATGETKNPQAGQTAGTGETVTAGDVSWVVSDASRETELRTYTFPPKSVPGSYVSVDFTVENVSDRPVTLTGDTISLFDAEGNEFRPEPDRNSTFVRPELNILFNEHSLIQPGESKEGRVNFGVLSNSSGFRALLGDTDPSVSEGRYVDLRF
jgi:Domain of unknown function (DUF4352)